MGVRRYIAGGVGLLAMLFPLAVRAQTTLTWSSGTGTWNTTASNWSNGSGSTTWGSGDTAAFTGAGGTVTASGVTASGIVFGASGYTVAGSIVVAAPGFTVEADSDGTLSGSVAGASSYTLTKTGSGTLSITGSTALFGTVDVQGGVISLNAFSAADSSGVYNLHSGTSLLLNNGSGQSYFIGGLSGSGSVVATATSGTSTVLFDGTSNPSYSGVLADNGSGKVAVLMLGTTAAQTLTGASTYTGTTTVSSGTLTLSGAGAITGSAVSIVAGTLAVDNSGTNVSDRLSDSAALTMSGGTLHYIGNGSAGSSESAGKLTLSAGGAAVVVDAAGGQASVVAFNGVQRSQSGGTVDFSGSGTAQLTGVTNANGIVGAYATFGGTDWAAVDGSGNVSAYASYYTGSLGGASSTSNARLATAGTTTTLSGAATMNTLDLQNSASSQATLDAGGATVTLVSGGLLSSGTGDAAITDGSLASNAGELVVIDANNLTISANVVDGTSATALTKSGAGILSLGGTNTYTGATTIDAGTLRLQSSSALPTATTMKLSSYTTLDLNGYSATVGGLSGAGTVTLGSGRLTVSGSGSTSYAGAIGGTGGLTKSGSGTLTLTGLNGYTGATQILGGRLVLQSSAQVLSSSSAVVLGGGTLALGTIGTTQQLGTLTLQSNSTLDFASWISAGFAFSDSSALTWTGTLTISNFASGDTLRFGTSASGLTTAELADISFNGVGAQISASGYVTAVPEPGTMALLAAAGALAWMVRRRACRA